MDALRLASSAIATVLAAAFVLAVAGKAAAPGKWEMMAARVAGNGRRRRAMVVGVPLAEGLTAVALLACPPVGLAASAVLLAGLGAGVLALRERLAGEGCGCFGALAESRIGTALAVRNLIAAAIAAAAVPAWGTGLLVEPLGLAIGAGAAGAAVLVLRIRAARAVGGPRLGSRIRVPGLVQGRPTVIAFVAASCPPCQRLAPTLLDLTEAHPGVNLVTAIAPLGGQVAGEGLDRIAVPGLWDRLAKRARVPATPYLVATDEAGRVVWHGTGNAERATNLLADLDRAKAAHHPGSLGWPTRRRALALAFGGAIAAAAAGSALGAVTRGRRPRIRREQQVRGVTYGNNGRNDFTGTCDGYRLRSRRGVVDSTGRQQEQVVGFTLAEGFDVENNCAPPPADKRLPLAAAIVDRRKTEHQRGRCPCPVVIEYDDIAECKAKCQQGLQCFGKQCETLAGEVCIEVLFSIKATKKPKITIDTLSWTPPASATQRCKVYANSFNDFVRRHEEQHAKDTLDAITQFESEEDKEYAKACAPTEQEADLMIAAMMVNAVDASYARLVEIDCAKNRNFHQSAGGRSGLPNCDMCK